MEFYLRLVVNMIRRMVRTQRGYKGNCSRNRFEVLEALA
jgi:hypothetical protein